MGRLAQREEQPDFVIVHREPAAEPGDPRGQQRGHALRPERQTDVGGADHLARQRADRGAGLPADHGPADLLHHRGQAAQAAADRGQGRAHLRRHLAEFFGVHGEHAAHGLDRLGRDRIA